MAPTPCRIDSGEILLYNIIAPPVDFIITTSECASEFQFDDASSDSETSVDDYSTDGATSSSRHDDNMSDFPQFGEFNNHEAFVAEIIREHEMQATNQDATRELVLLINQLLDCQMSMSGNAEERAVVRSPGSTSGPSSSSTSGPLSSSISGPSSRSTFDVSANGSVTHIFSCNRNACMFIIA